MAVQVLTTPKIWLNELALDPTTYRTASEYGVEPQDDTVFGDTTRSRTGGLKFANFSDAAYFEGGDAAADGLLQAMVGSNTVGRMVDPIGDSTAGNFVYMSQFHVARYSPFDAGEVGAMHAIAIEGANGSSTPQLRGQLLHSATETATTNGTEIAVGALSAGQTGYGFLSVTAASGTSPTLDVIIQHDTTGFPSPTSGITFTQATAATSQWSTTTSTTTDTFWRANITIGGGSPSFTFAVGFAIL